MLVSTAVPVYRTSDDEIYSDIAEMISTVIIFAARFMDWRIQVIVNDDLEREENRQSTVVMAFLRFTLPRERPSFQPHLVSHHCAVAFDYCLA